MRACRLTGPPAGAESGLGAGTPLVLSGGTTNKQLTTHRELGFDSEQHGAPDLAPDQGLRGSGPGRIVGRTGLTNCRSVAGSVRGRCSSPPPAYRDRFIHKVRSQRPSAPALVRPGTFR